MEQELFSLKKELDTLHDDIRTLKIQQDWNTSVLKHGLVIFMNYLIMLILMYILNIESPFISALLPTLGYAITSISLNSIKKYWIIYTYSENNSK